MHPKGWPYSAAREGLYTAPNTVIKGVIIHYLERVKDAIRRRSYVLLVKAFHVVIKKAYYLNVDLKGDALSRQS